MKTLRSSGGRAGVLTAAFVMVCLALTAHGQPALARMGLAEGASRRFPQPVRVGDLLHRTVLQPVESQTVLGHVRAIVRATDGTVAAVVQYGGVLGFGGRPIAVPLDAMALLGRDVEIVGFKPAQLAAFPTFTGSGFQDIAGGDIVKIGLAKPSH